MALTFGPAYVPFFKEANVSDVQVFKKEDYGDSFSEIQKQFGRKYYTVCSTMVKFMMPILSCILYKSQSASQKDSTQKTDSYS